MLPAVQNLVNSKKHSASINDLRNEVIHRSGKNGGILPAFCTDFIERYKTQKVFLWVSKCT